MQRNTPRGWIAVKFSSHTKFPRLGGSGRRGRRSKQSAAGAENAAIRPFAGAKKNFALPWLRIKPAGDERQMLAKFHRSCPQAVPRAEINLLLPGS